MNLSKLTTSELEERIDQYKNRIAALTDILKDIKDSKAKSTLQKHITSYKETIQELRSELSIRHKK
jgi:predicted  nucleic acid-binding Zn-ribbon protein